MRVAAAVVIMTLILDFWIVPEATVPLWFYGITGAVAAFGLGRTFMEEVTCAMPRCCQHGHGAARRNRAAAMNWLKGTEGIPSVPTAKEEDPYGEDIP